MVCESTATRLFRWLRRRRLIESEADDSSNETRAVSAADGSKQRFCSGKPQQSPFVEQVPRSLTQPPVPPLAPDPAGSSADARGLARHESVWHAVGRERNAAARRAGGIRGAEGQAQTSKAAGEGDAMDAARVAATLRVRKACPRIYDRATATGACGDSARSAPAGAGQAARPTARHAEGRAPAHLQSVGLAVEREVRTTSGRASAVRVAKRRARANTASEVDAAGVRGEAATVGVRITIPVVGRAATTGARVGSAHADAPARARRTARSRPAACAR